MRKPKAMPAVEAMPSRTVTNRLFLRRDCKENDLRRAAACSTEYSSGLRKIARQRENGRFFSHLRRFEFADGRKREILTPLLKIISGGQTGVDRGALDAALDLGVECGGWCPAGRLAEDGTIPERYPVIELTDGGYAERTAQNVADSDGTLIISNGEPMGGTRETVKRCVETQKPYLIVDCKLVPINHAIDRALKFISQLSSRAIARDGRWGNFGMTTVLNMAGPRASQWPGGHALTYQIMSAILRRISGQNDPN
jgi:hypothetical protein